MEIGGGMQMRQPGCAAMLISCVCVSRVASCQKAVGDRFTQYVDEQIERQLLAASLDVPRTVTHVVPMKWERPIIHLYPIALRVEDTTIHFHGVSPASRA